MSCTWALQPKRLCLVLVATVGAYFSPIIGGPLIAVEQADTPTPPSSSSPTCPDNLSKIRKAILEYAVVHQGWLPTNLMSLNRFLDDPTKLVCPADTIHPRPVSTNWVDFRSEMITYVIVGRHATTNDPHHAYLRCVRHENVILNSGAIGIYRGAK